MRSTRNAFLAGLLLVLSACVDGPEVGPTVLNVCPVYPDVDIRIYDDMAVLAGLADPPATGPFVWQQAPVDVWRQYIEDQDKLARKLDAASQ